MEKSRNRRKGLPGRVAALGLTLALAGALLAPAIEAAAAGTTASPTTEAAAAETTAAPAAEATAAAPSGERDEVVEKVYTITDVPETAAEGKTVRAAGRKAGRTAAPATAKAVAGATDYDKYGSRAVYGGLTAAEQALWDSMDRDCREALDTRKDYTPSDQDVSGSVTMGTYELKGLSFAAAHRVSLLLRWCNPQYYFLNEYCSQVRDDDDKVTALGLTMFAAFADGDERASATADYFQNVEKAVAEIRAAAAKAEGGAAATATAADQTAGGATAGSADQTAGAEDPTEFEYEQAAHDWLVSKMYYDWANYNQSAYSVFCGDSTVCMGYAAAFAVVCRACGLDCWTLTSDEHAWNEVCVEGRWYIVDCTWDDTQDGDYGKGSAIGYWYFNRSRTGIAAEMDKWGRKREWHDEQTVFSFNENFGKGEMVWPNVPECDSDSGGERNVLPAAAMLRLYNRNSGEHFYTASVSEKNNLVTAGWTYEGLAWTAPGAAGEIFRLYNGNAGDHHYTASASERDALIAAGWTYEGVGWCTAAAAPDVSSESSTGAASGASSETGTGTAAGASSETGTGAASGASSKTGTGTVAGASGNPVPVYRAYNPNSGRHSFTADVSEQKALAELGWQDEGIAWYGI